MDRATKAAGLFLEGYNCAQAVAVAFADMVGLEETQVARMVSGFGGGFGRLREVCGAVSGMVFVISTLYGYDSMDDNEVKMGHYKRIQDLAGQFREQNGSIICREILKNPPSDPAPSPRTADYYASRPCARMVYTAAKLVEDYIAANPL